VSETVIKAESLGYRTGHRYLLKDINWEVKQGQHWVIFGMNGSGKTTLLSVIAGFKKQTDGSLTVLGQNYGEHNVLQLRKRIGWVSSSFFDKYFTKESALYIVLSGLSGTFGLDGDIKDEQIVLAKQLLTRLGLGEKINHPFHLMSKGERQNVLIARALICKPDILVLDEPGTGLDVIARENMLHIVCELAEDENITILYVTHYGDEILNIFQHCMLLRNGRIYAQGPTKELMNSELLSNFLEYPVAVSQRDGKLHIDLTAKTSLKDLLQWEMV